jgi:uncharacterized protein DUF1206
MTLSSRTPAPTETVVHSDVFEGLSRAGFVARALIYGIIGILAVKLAVGAGGKLTDQRGALQTIADQPFGHALLVIVAVGLAGYALWRFTRAALGHGPEAHDSTFDRIAALASGLVYAGICAIAVELLLGGGGGPSSPPKATAGILGWPAGTWLVGLAGAVMIGVGLYQAYRGVSRDFLEDSKTEQMSPTVEGWIEWIGTVGHLARAVVFGLVGVFLIKAAIDFDPGKAIGIDGALAKLANSSAGPVLLGIVAGGLIAFAVYSLTDARYRRI